MKRPDTPIFLTKADLERLGIFRSNTTLLRWEFAGRFPRRVRLGPTSVCWLRHEVMSWCAERAAERATHVYADI